MSGQNGSNMLHWTRTAFFIYSHSLHAWMETRSPLFPSQCCPCSGRCGNNHSFFGPLCHVYTFLPNFLITLPASCPYTHPILIGWFLMIPSTESHVWRSTRSVNEHFACVQKLPVLTIYKYIKLENIFFRWQHLVCVKLRTEKIKKK